MNVEEYTPRIQELDNHISSEDNVLLIGFMAHSIENLQRKINDKNSVIDFVDKKRKNYLGTDIAPEGYQRVREEHEFNVKKENFLDSEYYEEFDVILAFKVIDHIPQLETFYQKVENSLAPGGKTNHI